METSHIVIVIALLGGFTCVGILASEAINGLRHRKRKSKVLVGGLPSSVTAHVMRNGVIFFEPFSKFLLRSFSIKKWINRYVGILGSLGYFTCSESLLSLVISVFFICLIFGFIVSGSFFVGISAFVCLVLFLGMLSRRKEEERKEKIREAIPEALQTMKTCFFAGYSLPQVFEQLVNDTQGPLRELFEKVVSVLNTGGTFDDALECIKRESEEQELVFLAAALEIQHKTGSSIEQVLEAARESVCDEIELKRTLRTQTAQAKLSAQIVTIMPFALIALFSIISEGFLAPFFESVAGVILLAVALFMQLLGIFLVRKMLRVGVM